MLARQHPAFRPVRRLTSAARTGAVAPCGLLAIKHGVLGLVRGLAADLRGTGVTATAVSPGSTDTSMLAATAGLYGLASPSELQRPPAGGPAVGRRRVAAACAGCAGPSRRRHRTVVHADGGFIG